MAKKYIKNGVSREKLLINQESYDIETDKLSLIGNEVSDNLFHSISTIYNPERVKNQRDKSGSKIIICLSDHDTRILDYKGNVKHVLEQSGLVVRTFKKQGFIGGDNIASLLNYYKNCIPLVSKIMKRWIDKETRYEKIKDLVFCLEDGNRKITNNLNPKLGGIRRKRLGR